MSSGLTTSATSRATPPARKTATMVAQSPRTNVAARRSSPTTRLPFTSTASSGPSLPTARRAAHVGVARGGAEAERRPQLVVELHVVGPHVALAAGRAVGDDRRVGAVGHGRDPWVVAVEDGEPVGRQRLHQLTLGLGHV